MKEKQQKFIDLNQLPHNKNGTIAWKNSVGIALDFYYFNEKHTIKILEVIDRNYLLIELDNKKIEKTHTSKIKNLTFDLYFYKPKYIYKIGEKINDIEIVNQIKIERKTNVGSKKVHIKGYICKCLRDNYQFEMSEDDLKNGHGCPVCAGIQVVKGINDIATTRPELKIFFVDVNDAYSHSEHSTKKVLVKCPYCGAEKYMLISELSRLGRVTCDRCGDGISYPNKFAHELFLQLKDQYLNYIFEYSPDWAEKKRYDNYIVLNNGKELIVEMDGAYHFVKNTPFSAKNDTVKDTLAHKYNISVIRVNCFYNSVGERFNFIKNNIIKSLSEYFDLSHIDWEKCNNVAISSRLIAVINYYLDHPRTDLKTIANTFCISMETLYNYLYVAEDLGLCTYLRNDPGRSKNSKPIAMYDSKNNLVGIYKSANYIEHQFPHLRFNARTIRQYAHKGKIYKNYIFKFITYEEYQAHNYA